MGSPTTAGKVTADNPRPEVILDIDFVDGLLFVSLRNIGARPAYAVKTSLSPPFKGLGGSQEFNGLAIFEGIEFFAPAKEIRFLLDSASAYFARREPVAITAQLTYRDDQGTEFQAVIKHNLEIYRSLAYVVR